VGIAFGHEPLLFGFAQGQPGFFVEIGEQHIFHGCVSPALYRTARARIDSPEHFF
jgi:hypothetical protein